MSYVTTEPTPFPAFTTPPGRSALRAWLRAGWRLVRWQAAPSAPVPRDLAREAAEVRAWAETVRRGDPRFADDLFAAADRHEALGARSGP
jgi:hypothetical protein